MLTFTTRAPWSTTQRIPAVMSSTWPLILRSSTLATISVASGATPAMPTPLLAVAAATPATNVPWPLSSWPAPRPHPPMQLTWAAIRGARSSWSRSTPLSTMPMVTPRPVLRVHASAAWMRSSDHWVEYCGSVEAPAGAAVTARTKATIAIALAMRMSDFFGLRGLRLS
jgi:hypothetical protein